MNNQNAPIQVFHSTLLFPICLVVALLFSSWVFMLGVVGPIFFLAAVLLLALVALVEVRTVSFHDKYLTLNYYLLRKRRIDYSDIDYVSFETRRHRFQEYNFISVELASGKKIRLGGFKEGNQLLYEQLKARESTNEEFLKARRT